jgi:hypothetical protein
MGSRREFRAGVEVGVPGRVSGDVVSRPDNGNAAGQVAAGNGPCQRVLDGDVLWIGARAGQREKKENGTNNWDAH